MNPSTNNLNSSENVSRGVAQKDTTAGDANPIPKTGIKGNTFNFSNLQTMTNIMFNCKFLLNVEIVLLCVLIMGVWSLLSLHILLYYLPLSQVNHYIAAN